LNTIHCTKGDVSLLFADKRLKPITDTLQFQTADQWQELLDGIPYGIAGQPWSTSPISIAAPTMPGEPARSDTYQVLHQDPLDIIKFQLSFPPFQRHLKYSPERVFCAPRTSSRQASPDVGSSRGQPTGSPSEDDAGLEDVRMYTDLSTSDWWWDTQLALPPGATVVPVMIGVDKTHLTNHTGDQVAWPVYISVGNLSPSVRRSRKLPGTLLAALLPSVKHHDLLVRTDAYHKCMQYVLASRFLYPSPSVVLR
jgi:hypothetical protein